MRACIVLEVWSFWDERNFLVGHFIWNKWDCIHKGEVKAVRKHAEILIIPGGLSASCSKSSEKK